MSSVLTSPTLVLNKNWMAIGVNPVQHAICKVSDGNARIVDPHDFQLYTWADWAKLKPKPGEDVVRSANGPVRSLDVIVLTYYDKIHSQAVACNRRNIFARDRNTCQYCGCKPGTENLSIDHVTPECQGGITSWDNCVLACIECNVRKGGRTPLQAKMKLLKPPVRPKWTPTFRTRMIKPTWERFVNDLYWNVELK